MSATGRVSLIGAGPGDPDLLTVRGARRLAEADLVLYDALSSAEMRALAPAARWFYVGKRACRQSIAQDVLNRLMIKHARRGRHVVRLKCGDPFVFGRGGEEALALAEAGIPVEVVPGVSTAIAAPALAGIPVTHRGMASSFAVVTGHHEPVFGPILDALPPTGLTLVVLMGVRQRAVVASRLVARGWPASTPAALVVGASTPQAWRWTGRLGDLGAAVIPEASAAAPGTLVIGEVVALADRLALGGAFAAPLPPAPIDLDGEPGGQVGGQIRGNLRLIAGRDARMSLTVRNLTKRFTARGTPAVADVSFTAPEGGITTLLGPSGSGKSTVLRVVAGLEQPDSGAVLFGDQDFTYMPAQRRGVGFVFQSYALFKHMNVRKNIAFGLRVRKVPAAEARRTVDELLALVQLEGLGERFPAQLSGGQRQRVAFARALAIAPKVLLLDEPFGALDAQVRVELRDWLRKFHQQRHVTTLLVTHDQEEAMEVSDRVVVMHDGRVAQAGPPQEVYDRPATPFVASFVGGANVLRGQMRDGRAAIGSLGSFAVPATLGTQAPDGTAVHAFVRPHDVTLTKASITPDGTPDGTPGGGKPAGDGAPEISIARVERLAWLGGHVKVTLKLADGAPMTVQMPKSEVEALGIAEGDMVMANLREAKVFVEDYSI